MPKYYTGEPWWGEGNKSFDAQKGDAAFQHSAKIREEALRMAGDPQRYQLRQYLGHSCVVAVREAHPYKDKPREASLRDVVGLAIGPGGSVHIEEHRTWKGTPKNWRVDTFGNNNGGCRQWAREPIGTVYERHLSDCNEDDTTDVVIPNTALGISSPYISMELGLNSLATALDNPSASNTDPYHIFFVGTEAAEMTGALMEVGHRFSHPALQAWQADLIALTQQAA